MVVLISGVSLAGYVAWRLTLSRGGRVVRGGLILTGLLGGLVSSTATTLVYARHAREGTHTHSASLMIIVLANAAMLLRVTLVSAIVAPAAALPVITATLPALLLTSPTLIRTFRRTRGESPANGGEYRNPTNLLAACTFALTYALILLVAAWLSQDVGVGGLYGLAVISGMTDVDAITLSSLALFKTGALGEHGVVTVIALAVAANLIVKAGIATVAGGRDLGRAAILALSLPLVGLAFGTWLLRNFG